jgi:phage recombination protein Bet
MTLVLPSQDNYLTRLDVSQVETLKNTVAKDCNDQELNLLLYVATRTGLDPFMKQIYAIVRKSKQKDGSYKSAMTIQTGIDGFRLIAERTGKYSPGREPTYAYDQQGKLRSATAYIKKMTPDGTWHEIGATAFWDEYVQTDYNGNPTSFWKKMPNGQLAKCAESLALRKGFPGDYNQLYSHEEMAQAGNEVQAVQEAVVEKVEPKIEHIVPDLSTEEIAMYLTNYPEDERVQFTAFMKDMIEKKKWTYRTCIDLFMKYPDYTKKTFLGWQMTQVGI